MIAGDRGAKTYEEAKLLDQAGWVNSKMLVNAQRTWRRGFGSELLILAFYWLCGAVLVPLFVSGLSGYLEPNTPRGTAVSFQRGE
jgi:hypothetical protein